MIATTKIRGFGTISLLGVRTDSENLPTYTATFFFCFTDRDDREGSQKRRALAAMVSFCFRRDGRTGQRITDGADFLVREVLSRPALNPVIIVLNRADELEGVFARTKVPTPGQLVNV